MSLAEKVKAFCEMLSTPTNKINQSRFLELISGVHADLEEVEKVDISIFAEMTDEHRKLCLSGLIAIIAIGMQA